MTALGRPLAAQGRPDSDGSRRLGAGLLQVGAAAVIHKQGPEALSCLSASTDRRHRRRLCLSSWRAVTRTVPQAPIAESPEGKQGAAARPSHLMHWRPVCAERRGAVMLTDREALKMTE